MKINCLFKDFEKKINNKYIFYHNYQIKLIIFKYSYINFIFDRLI